MTTSVPLHDERVTAVRDKFMDVRVEEVSDENVCLSRSMTIKAHNKIVASCDQYVTPHVPLTPETKNSINKESLMRMPEVHEAELLDVLSARPDFDAPPKNAEEVKARRRQTRLTSCFQYTCDDSESQGV